MFKHTQKIGKLWMGWSKEITENQNSVCNENTRHIFLKGETASILFEMVCQPILYVLSIVTSRPCLNGRPSMPEKKMARICSTIKFRARGAKIWPGNIHRTGPQGL